MTQEYVTTQIVTAWASEQDGEPGYSVKDEAGNITWRAKAAFEASHIAMGHTGHLAPHERRVVAEKAQNDDRVTKLTAFVGTERFRGLNSLDRQRLEIQLSGMSLVGNVLSDRVDDFPPAPSAEPAPAAESAA